MNVIDTEPAPRAAPLDPALFRAVLGRFATGVTVVTTVTPEGARTGVTASSFNTLSLDPPLILWSLALKAPSLALFRAAGRFAVNILGHDQVALAMQFSRPCDDKFRGIETRQGVGGVPLISGAIAHLECTVEQRVPGGDHELYIGRIVRAEYTDRQPLIFNRGRFGQFADLN